MWREETKEPNNSRVVSIDLKSNARDNLGGEAETTNTSLANYKKDLFPLEN